MSQIRGRGRTMSEINDFSVWAWLTASPASAVYQPLPCLVGSIWEINIELFNPAHLTLWSNRIRL